MEQRLFERLLVDLRSISAAPSPLRALSTARSLVVHPGSSEATRSAVLDALIRLLSGGDCDPTVLRHVIELIGDIAALHRSLGPAVVSSLRPLLDDGDGLAAEVLAVFVSMVESGVKGGGEEGVSLITSVLDEGVILSLASSSVVAVRLRLIDLLVFSLGGVQRFSLLRPGLVFRLFVGLAADLYPSVRRAAIEGLVLVCKEARMSVNASITRCCYDCGVELLGDEDELVRVAAIRLVSQCGQRYASGKDESGSKQIDMSFIQISSMARDMSMSVRMEAFIALGKLRLVSESVLLQSLSKKILSINSAKKEHSDTVSKEFKFPVSRAAGALIHGLEDEFSEVRKAACKTLGLLAIYSIRFSNEALNLLMDMLNDDATAVRLQTLRTLFLMATYGRLDVQEKHMHMFLGLLADTNGMMRHSAREVIRMMKFPSMDTFRSSINSLIANYKIFPEEEGDVFYVLFFIGKDHGKFAAKLVKEFVQEEIVTSQGELSLDSPQVAAFLVLAISLSFWNEKLKCDIPAAVYSYAVALFGRISCSLTGVIDQDSLLAFLCQRSGMLFSATLKSDKDEILPVAARILPHNKQTDQVCSSACLVLDEALEAKFTGSELDLRQNYSPFKRCQGKAIHSYEEIMHFLNPIMETIKGTWLLIQSQRTYEAQSILSTCKEELKMIGWNANGSAGAMLAFASEYVQVIQVFSEIWKQLQPKSFHISGTGRMEFLFDKVDVCLRRIRCGFPGLSKEEECHILELMLLSCVLRLSNVGIGSCLMLEKLGRIISRMELLSEDGSCNISDFAQELKKYLSHGKLVKGSEHSGIHKLLELFNIELFPLRGRFRHIEAELQVPDNDSENPLPFISGLPVGITFQITLSNISSNKRLWIRMAAGDSTQYTYLDPYEAGCDELRKCTINLPFYSTPKAVSFVLNTAVIMECPLEDLTNLKKGQQGPKHETIFISDEKDVYLARRESM